ncbi:MAG: OmpH family outer membrane protein [Bacteroidales bacterium]|nr:OmpH family outer membrane protein [Bacteroidales bacterium]
MINKGKNLKMMIATFMLSVAMVSCNQPNNSGTVEANDSMNTEVSTPEVSVDKTENSKKVSTFNGELKIVFIDTDSLVTRYKFFTDGNDRMVKMEQSMRYRLESKSKKLQKEYEEYMRQGKAGLLTLKQQQDTEASLTKQQQDLATLEQNLTDKLMTEKQLLNTQINTTVAEFIEIYRVEKGYTFIMQKQTLNGVLSGDPSLDVTDEVISRLNAKYEFETKHQ